MLNANLRISSPNSQIILLNADQEISNPRLPLYVTVSKSIPPPHQEKNKKSLLFYSQTVAGIKKQANIFTSQDFQQSLGE